MVVTIIIPVYNERALIARLLSDVIASDTSPFLKELIVVDDGSSDGTGEILREFSGRTGINVITHPKNMGKASAIKSALKAAAGDIVLIQDADLEYSPSDFKKLLAPFADKDTVVVYGSRFLSARVPEGMKALNLLANKLFTFLVNFLYKAGITDEGTAYKLFRMDAIKGMDIKCSGFEFCPEVTAKLLKKGVRIIEVPVSYRARGRKEGKKPGFVDGLKVLWTILKYRFVK
ncbi:MAG: glycosyltransferase family 2 protein [Thermodesulfovibrionales bacterium]|nr:glycosyltransferase family 2 protein [Thermodesulfovibrionales bacterium]